MIGHSAAEYVFIRISIFGLRAIAPLSISYVAFYLAKWYQGDRLESPALTALAVYTALEAGFYLFVYLPRSKRLQKPTEHPPSTTKEERQALFAKCFARVRHSELATGWFHSSPASAVKRENLTEWILWALFSSNRDNYQEDWEEEVLGYVEKLEKLLGRELDPGWDEEVRSMRVTLDPVVSLHRPLVWYTIVCIVDTYTSFILHLKGFQHFTRHRWFVHFPPRIYPGPSQKSPSPDISYWYRPHTSTRKHPIVFLHGIGIGLWPYCPFFSEIIAADPGVGILAIENLQISMRISPPPLDRTGFLAGFSSILEAHGITRFVIAGHSYGTVMAAHILRDPTLSPRVVALQLIDPIPFLLHLPAVAYNFVYRKPRTANEWQLWYFASRDPDIARFLARHFFWAENILWKEDLEGKPVGVALSGSDQIVDVQEVWAYLTDSDAEITSRWKEDKLELLFYPDLDHSQVFDTPQLRKPLIDMLTRFCDDDTSESVSD